MPAGEVTVQSARRAALDHVLGLITAAPWSGGLVLRLHDHWRGRLVSALAPLFAAVRRAA
ncbi:hypothetical protein ACTMTU_01880 [Streptomyces sp. OZ13]|uniref:hypothetical protein n=1 Tax=Streptomyces sp. OZ13 TaxID=3452210 RepID=UPI003F892D87